MADDRTPVSRVLGVGECLEFDGKVYHLSPFSYERRGEFEAWCSMKARQEVSKCKPLVESKAMDYQEYQRLSDACDRLILSGYYAFGGEGYSHRESTAEGMVYKTYLMMQPRHPDIRLSVVEAIYSAKFEEILSAVGETNRDPNPPRTA